MSFIFTHTHTSFYTIKVNTMDDMAWEELLAEDAGIPDGEHADLMFEGLDDLVSGVESYATRYAKSVVWASQCTNHLVTGVESFVGSVSEGIKKVWEYIKKMFATILSFFAKKKGKAATDEVVKKIDYSINSIGIINSSNIPDPEQVVQLKKVIARTEVRVSDKAKPVIEKLAVGNTSDPKEVKEVATRCSDLFYKDNEHIANIAERIARQIADMEASVETFKTKFEALDKEDLTGIPNMVPRFITVLKGTSGLLPALNQVHSAASAEHFLFTARHCLTAMSHNFIGVGDSVTPLNRKLSSISPYQDRPTATERRTIEALKLVIGEVLRFIKGYEKLVSLIDLARGNLTL